MRILPAALIALVAVVTPARAAPAIDEGLQRALELRAEVAPGRSESRFDKVLADLAELVKRAPARDDVALALAETLAWAGRYDAAIDAYTAIVRRDDTVAAAWAGIARVRSWQGRWDEAAVGFERLTRKLPERYEGWVGLGEVEMVRGRLPQAREAFERASRIAPENADVLVHRAEAELWNGSVATALRLVSEALQIEPGNTKAIELRTIARLRSAPVRIGVGYALATVTGLDPWQAGQLQLSWDATPGLLAYARGERFARFGLVHWQAVAGLLWEPAPRWGVFAEGTFVPNAVYLPGWSAKVGAFHGFSANTYLSFEYAYLAYTGVPVHLMKPAISQRLPLSTQATLATYLGVDATGRLSGAAALELGWRPVESLELSAGLSAGVEPTRFISADGTIHEFQSVVRWPARATWTIRDLHTIEAYYLHELRAGTWSVDQFGLSFGVRL